MNYDERVAVAQRLTAASYASPRLYRIRVVFWILLGYVLVGALLALALAMSGGVLAIVIAARHPGLLFIGWMPLAFSWMLLRALFVRLELPEGRVLQRREAPKLFALIDEIRERAGVRRLDMVLLGADLNASVIETPRFGGLFGWRRHLLLGLPLMLTHSTEELRAILAHEFGHLSRYHARTPAWSWRVRVTWMHVLSSLDARRGLVTNAVRRMFRWYVDHLMTTTLVQARTQELEADRFAAEVTSAETTARTLAWLRVADRRAEERFWKPLWAMVAERPTPPPPLDSFVRRRAEIFAPPYDDVLEKELALATSVDDTHPSLRERLKRLGHARPALALGNAFAADELFGRNAAAMVAEFDRAWTQNVRTEWEERRREVEKARETLAAGAADDHARAESFAALGRDDEAFDLYASLAEQNPQDVRAAFHYGRLLVQRGDLDGIRHLSRAMELDWRCIAPACEIAYAALREKGRDREADAWNERYQLQCESIAAAQAEASQLTSRDDLGPTTLDAATQELILAKCREEKWVSKLWLASKRLTSVPASAECVAIVPKIFRNAPEHVRRLIEALPASETPIIVFLVEDGSVIRRLNRIEGARRM